MSLQILVLGAGIAGLSAAIALTRDTRHTVTILEKSQFASETGAALAISPNGARALASLGFDFEAARALKMNHWEGVSGTDLRQLSNLDLSDAESVYHAGSGGAENGRPMYSLHRVDLHEELRKLARGVGERIKLELSSNVVGVDAEAGSVTMADGTVRSADLIVGADGLHSVARKAVLGGEGNTAVAGMSAFRFLIPTTQVENEPLYKWKRAGGVTILADTTTSLERHVTWYGCRDNEVQNVVGIHPTRSDVLAGQEQGLEQDQAACKQLLLDEYKHFHPDVLRLFALAQDVKIWPLVHHEPFNRWSAGKVVIIGDAAHPMLPFGGQAANQAIEDSVALGRLLKEVEGGKSTDTLGERLAMFQKLRIDRASMIQVLSSARIGREKEVEGKLRPFVAEGQAPPGTFAERQVYTYKYDIIDECDKFIAKMGIKV